MRKTSPGTSILRNLMTLALLFFAVMIYWSSVNEEALLLEIKGQLAQIKKTLDNRPAAAPATSSISVSSRTHIDPLLPNLLLEDPFYQSTLPRLLGSTFTPHGALTSSTFGKPNNLLPLNEWATVATWNGLCGISVARGTTGFYESLSPYGAVKMEARGEQEYWVHLRENIFWEPLKREFFPSNFNLADGFLTQRPVTAHDYKFYFDSLMNPFNQQGGALALRSYLEDIENIEVIDDLTFVVKWKLHEFKQPDGTLIKKKKYNSKMLTGFLMPLPSHIYQYFADGTKIIEDDQDPSTYKNNSIWAQNFSQHWAKNTIVSCGPYLFDGMSEREIKLVRNPSFYSPLAALVEQIKINFRGGSETIWQDFKFGINDTHELTPDELMQYQDFIQSPLYKTQSYPIEHLEFLQHAYSYLAWNMTNPLFASKKVRQALTMAIDRKRIIEKNLRGMGEEIHGTFDKYSPSTDPSITPWPYDVEASKRLLAEEGWYDSTGDGVIDKIINGKRMSFRFTILYFVKNAVSKSVCEYIASALKDVGIECSLNGVDLADLTSQMNDKSFDALFLAWSSGAPPEDPYQLWHSTWAKEKGSSNIVGFANPEADAIIEQLQFESNLEKRKELYHAFDRILHEEQPYTFLYSPKMFFLYRSYVQNVFIPADKQELIPGANVTEPDSSIFWIKK